MNALLDTSWEFRVWSIEKLQDKMMLLMKEAVETKDLSKLVLFIIKFMNIAEKYHLRLVYSEFSGKDYLWIEYPDPIGKELKIVIPHNYRKIVRKTIKGLIVKRNFAPSVKEPFSLDNTLILNDIFKGLIQNG